MIPIRSFFPVATLVVILGSVVWGPWISLALTATLWFAIDALENALPRSRQPLGHAAAIAQSLPSSSPGNASR